jgi:glycosyltransferase involved in cell wall biosynthesis
MKLLMISADTAVAQGTQGAFWNTLSGFHVYWERIDIICPHVPAPSVLTAFDNVHFHPVPRGKLLSSFYVFLEGLKIARELKPHLLVIHAFGTQLMSWGGYWLARRLHLPFVVEVHHVEGIPKMGSALDYLRLWMTLSFLRLVHHHAKAIRVVNRSELVPLLLSHGIPSHKLKLLHSVYLDRSVFYPMQNLTKEYEMIFVGRLVPNKGLALLIQTFDCLKEKLPNARLLIIGRGPLQGWLENELRSRKGIKHIPFLPSVNQLAQVYNEAKVVVCASFAEGGPRFVVEAMACGLPAVSTPVGLSREIIEDGETGFVLQSWSPQEMAAKILILLQSADVYVRCSKKAIEVASQFDYEPQIARYALAYQELLSK